MVYREGNNFILSDVDAVRFFDNAMRPDREASSKRHELESLLDRHVNTVETGGDSVLFEVSDEYLDIFNYIESICLSGTTKYSVRAFHQALIQNTLYECDGSHRWQNYSQDGFAQKTIKLTKYRSLEQDFSFPPDLHNSVA